MRVIRPLCGMVGGKARESASHCTGETNGEIGPARAGLAVHDRGVCSADRDGRVRLLQFYASAVYAHGAFEVIGREGDIVSREREQVLQELYFLTLQLSEWQGDDHERAVLEEHRDRLRKRVMNATSE